MVISAVVAFSKVLLSEMSVGIVVFVVCFSWYAVWTRLGFWAHWLLSRNMLIDRFGGHGGRIGW